MFSFTPVSSHRSICQTQPVPGELSGITSAYHTWVDTTGISLPSGRAASVAGGTLLYSTLWPCPGVICCYYILLYISHSSALCLVVKFSPGAVATIPGLPTTWLPSTLQAWSCLHLPIHPYSSSYPALITLLPQSLPALRLRFLHHLRLLSSSVHQTSLNCLSLEASFSRD